MPRPNVDEIESFAGAVAIDPAYVSELDEMLLYGAAMTLRGLGSAQY